MKVELIYLGMVRTKQLRSNAASPNLLFVILADTLFSKVSFLWGYWIPRAPPCFSGALLRITLCIILISTLNRIHHPVGSYSEKEWMKNLSQSKVAQNRNNPRMNRTFSGCSAYTASAVFQPAKSALPADRRAECEASCRGC